MSLTHIDGNRFKKMVMSASGTKNYLSSSVQKSLHEAGANKFMQSGAKISRRQAVEVIRKLKNDGLTPKIGGAATNFVTKGFAKENQRQENIKRQNVEVRKNEIEAEKQAELAKTGKPAVAQQQMATHLAGGGTLPTIGRPKESSSFAASSPIPQVANQTPTTPTAPVNQPGAWPEEWQKANDDISDLAID